MRVFTSSTTSRPRRKPDDEGRSRDDAKKGKKAKNKTRALATRTLAQKRASGVKGGCATGAHYKTVTIEMRKAGGDPNSIGKAF